MKRMFGVTAALAMLAICISSAEAVISIETATVQSGAAFIKGKSTIKSAQIFWQGTLVNHGK
jgi:hypothetical protein